MSAKPDPAQSSSQHWWCEACNTFDGPIAGQFCDVCADGTEVKYLILAETALAATFDALSHMDPATANRWRDEASYERLAEALRR